MTRSIRRWAVCLPLLAAVFVAAPAAADDPKPVLVTVTPKGQPWSIGRFGGMDCAPTCNLHIPVEKYVVSVGGAKEEFLIDTPIAITYSPGAPRLRTIAGWTAIGGVGLGGVLFGLGVYAFAKSCATSQSCPALDFSRTTKQVLVTMGAVLISISVTGAILYAVSGESITARDLPPERAGWRSFDVRFNPSSQGATLDFVKRF